MPRKPPNKKPELLVVPKLATPSERKPGRPSLSLPPIPAELLDAMEPLEKEWFHYIMNVTKNEFPDLSPLEEFETFNFALEMVSVMRLHAQQLKSKELVTMSRQHPAVQARAWLDQLRKGRSGKPVEKPDPLQAALLDLSS